MTPLLVTRCQTPPGAQDASTHLGAWRSSWLLLSWRRGDLVLLRRRHERALGRGSGWSFLSFLTMIRRYAAAARPRTWLASSRPSHQARREIGSGRARPLDQHTDRGTNGDVLQILHDRNQGPCVDLAWVPQALEKGRLEAVCPVGQKPSQHARGRAGCREIAVELRELDIHWPRTIRRNESLCTTTRCSAQLPLPDRIYWLFSDPVGPGYAGCCKLTSENSSSTHSGE